MTPITNFFNSVFFPRVEESIQIKAERGDAEAQYNLGELYYNGQGVPQDASQAVAWYQKAAEQGHAKAQYSLGVCYAKGEGVPKDDSQAVSWSQKAAEQGHAKAQYSLGLCYANGEGVPKDDSQAVSWYKKLQSRDLQKPNSFWETAIKMGKAFPKTILKQFLGLPKPPSKEMLPLKTI